MPDVSDIWDLTFIVNFQMDYFLTQKSGVWVSHGLVPSLRFLTTEDIFSEESRPCNLLPLVVTAKNLCSRADCKAYFSAEGGVECFRIETSTLYKENKNTFFDLHSFWFIIIFFKKKKETEVQASWFTIQQRKRD